MKTRHRHIPGGTPRSCAPAPLPPRPRTAPPSIIENSTPHTWQPNDRGSQHTFPWWRNEGGRQRVGALPSPCRPGVARVGRGTRRGVVAGMGVRLEPWKNPVHDRMRHNLILPAGRGRFLPLWGRHLSDLRLHRMVRTPPNMGAHPPCHHQCGEAAPSSFQEGDRSI